jgi:hypothetical protein
VIEGGGWVGVGEERTRVQAGEAVVWPADVTHAAWTEGAPMRAIVVELPPPALEIPGVLDGSARPRSGGSTRSRPGGSAGPAGGVARVDRGEGALAPRPRPSVARDRAEDAEEGEPL